MQHEMDDAIAYYYRTEKLDYWVQYPKWDPKDGGGSVFDDTHPDEILYQYGRA